MHDMGIFDGRPTHRRSGNTSASSHPELLSGDLAVPPRPYVSITSMNRSVASSASRRTFGMLAVFAIVALLSTVLFKAGDGSDEAKSAELKVARSCMQWHLAAGAVVSRMVQSTRDTDLQQVGDAIFRMRRARRNCETGWATVACQDYHAVVASVPGHILSNQLFACSRIH